MGLRRVTCTLQGGFRISYTHLESILCQHSGIREDRAVDPDHAALVMRCFVLQEQQQATMRLTGLLLPPVILLEFVAATAFNEVTGPFPLKPVVSRMP